MIHRLTNPILSLLPDLNHIPIRRQATWALIVSVALHFVVLIAIVLASGLLPPPSLDFARSKPKVQDLELTLVLPEPQELQIVQPEDLIKPRNERETIDSTGLTKSDAAPEKAVFESDENMKAASEKKGAGDAPLPTMDGKTLPFTNFKTQDVLLGSPKLPPAPEDISLNQPAPPLFKSQPVPKLTETAAAPKATPPPLREVEKPNDNELALAEKAKPIPEPITRVVPQTEVKPPVATPAPQEKTEMAKLVTPPRSQPGFQAHQEQTKIEGSITNIGKPAVDAVKTPLAVYKKQVNAAIGSRWYYYVRERRDLIAFGSVKVSYAITAQGKIVDVRVVTNTSNDSLARICEQSIREAEVGPPPDEAQASMSDGRLEADLTFTYYNTQ